MRATLRACVWVAAAAAAACPRGAAGQSAPYRVVWDDFRDGFAASGPSARWFHFSALTFVGDDGVATTDAHGLRVVASGTNPTTGEPAFVRTVGQEGSADNLGPLPGDLDHVKWLVFANHFASTGHPGFDLEPGREVQCEAWLSGRTYGTAGHPFGDAVADPEDDPRLASPAMNAVDFESFVVADFFLTNRRIYALYERLPFGRGAQGAYAAFTALVPVAERRPDDWHRLSIGWNRSAGTIRWLIGGREVYRVDRIGFLPDRAHVTLDHGGVETLVEPRQVACGMGTFTVLDGSRPGDVGLARLTRQPAYYFDPDRGAPFPVRFVDDASERASRLFGQGAELRVRSYAVSSVAAP